VALGIELTDVVLPVWRRVPVSHQPLLEILGDRKREQHDDRVRRTGVGIDPHGVAPGRINSKFMGSTRQRR
jgi:hypothetical protein